MSDAGQQAEPIEWALQSAQEIIGERPGRRQVEYRDADGAACRREVALNERCDDRLGFPRPGTREDQHIVSAEDGVDRILLGGLEGLEPPVEGPADVSRKHVVNQPSALSRSSNVCTT